MHGKPSDNAAADSRVGDGKLPSQPVAAVLAGGNKFAGQTGYPRPPGGK